MIIYNVVILTELTEIKTAEIIEVQLGTVVNGMDGDTVRSFIRCTNKAYELYPTDDCLHAGLEFIPPEFHSLFEHLYEKLGELIT